MNPFRRPDGPPRTPVLASLPTARSAGGTSTLRLYDPIDSWGGDWGVSAKEFVAAIDALPDDTSEIRVLINSPGGMVYEGIAIMNALRSHSARVVAVVEGIAASAASFIAASADEVIMMRNSEMFIHNAIGMTFGDAADHRETAVDLDHFDLNIANVYAAKSGKSSEHWLAEMHKNRFLTAEQAVDEGLADRIEGDGDATAARAKFDLSVFNNHPGQGVRAAIPDKLPVSTEPGDPNRKETVVANDDLTAGLRERLGVTDATATDEQLLAAVDTLRARAEVTAPPAIPAGTVLIEEGVLNELRAGAQAGAEALAEQARTRRDGVVQAALNSGRISAAQAPTWRAKLDDDEAGVTELLEGLEANRVPVAEIGKSDTVNSAEDALYAAAFSEEGVTA